MPYLQIQTNLDISPDQQVTFLATASQMVAKHLNKAESYVMVALQTQVPMLFAGTNQPTAFLELKNLRLPTSCTPDLSREICAFVEQSLRIPKDRVYIEFINVDPSLWGWNGQTF